MACLAAILGALFLMFWLSPATGQTAASALCAGGCDPSSQHRLASCTYSDGMNHYRYGYNVSIGELFRGLKQACSDYAQAHSDNYQTGGFVFCNPVTTLPYANSGGSAASFSINGHYISRRNSDGVVLSNTTGDWSLGSCGCEDARNSNFARVGIDGQCYCPAGQQWVEGLQTCITYRDRYHDKPSCSDPGFGDPIFPLTGSERMTIDLGSGMQIAYDTRRMVPSNNPALAFSAVAPASFGGLWESSLHKVISTQDGLVVGKKAVHANRGAGVWISFVQGVSSSLAPDADVNDRITEVFNPVRLYRYDDAAAMAQETYSSAGVLQSINGADGTSLTYTYSTSSTLVEIAPAAGLLIQVSDHFGRSLKFTYAKSLSTSKSQLTTMIPATGLTTRFAYDASGRLSQIVWPDAATRQFEYGRSDLPWAMTAAVDENGKRSTISYDSTGLATASQLPGGVGSHSAAWAAAPSWNIIETYDALAGVIWRDHVWNPPAGATVTLPNGQLASFSVTTLQGATRVTRRSQPAGSGCSASSSAQQFDANANVTQSDDFNGSRTCFAYDGAGRNLELVRVEGLPSPAECAGMLGQGATLPSGSRKVSSAWHPDWRLRTRTAEAGRLSTYVYHGQPDPFDGNVLANCAPAWARLPDGKPIAVLCKGIQQSTTDSDGSQGFGATLQSGIPSRVQTWTYNEYGQVLTATDPLNNVTRYIYYADTTAEHTQGDLQALTDALGHVSQFTRYDAAGKLLQAVDANGVVTRYTYDPRQRLSSADVGGQVTGYDYALTGQLRRATEADGSFVAYEYDHAQRPVAVQDSAGNRIEYTLDSAGNAIAQTVRDNAGTLRRQLTRVMDALGRVRQVVGRE